MRFLDRITLLSFLVGAYALYIGIENLKENREQNDDLKSILNYLDNHLQDQDEILKNLTR